MRYDCVIWDWNGTLIDDMPVSLAAVNRILAVRGMPPINDAQYYDYIDTPITKFYEHLFDLEKTDVSVLLREFNANYDALLSGDEVSEGTRCALEAVKAVGARQAVLSACEQTKLVKLLCEYGIAPYFTDVFGADDLHCRDKTDKAREYFAAEELDPERAVLIGDTVHDASVASAVGCDCILVRCGHQSAAELERVGCPLAENAEDAVRMILK